MDNFFSGCIVRLSNIVSRSKHAGLNPFNRQPPGPFRPGQGHGMPATVGSELERGQKSALGSSGPAEKHLWAKGDLNPHVPKDTGT